MDTAGFIPQYADALSLQGPRPPPVQMPIAAQPQGVAHGEVVIAQDGIDAQGSRQPAQGGRDSVYVAISLVHKIAGQNNEIGILSLRQVDGFTQVSGCHLPTAMEVR